MARMIPNQPDADTPPSERYVFEKLRKSLPESWIVLHARRIVVPASGQKRAIEGEIDFVVVDPQRGWVGLEVKGGGVGRESGAWYSVDGAGRKHPIKDPGLQASKAVRALDSYLQRQRWFRQNRSRPRFGWAVVFPDVDVSSSLGPELPREVVICRSDLAELSSTIDRLFLARDVTGPPLPAGALSALIEALAPTMHLVKPLARRLEEESELLVRLTEEQKAALDLLEAARRIAIEGAAGTGKTLLAVEKARRLSRSGKKVLLLCFNRPLADFLAAGAGGYKVQNFHGLCHDLVVEAGLPFNIPQAAKAQREFWETEAPARLLEALDRLNNERYDAVVVDEGQDFHMDWWVAVEGLLRNPEAGELIVFFDPNQNLYGGGPPTALAVAPLRLRWNCRNTSNIAKYAAQLVGTAAEVKPGTPEGVRVEEIQCANAKEAIDTVRRTLHRFLVSEAIASDQVVVLSTHNHKRSLLNKSRNLGPATLVPFGEPLRPKQVRFGSLQRFKGLEADVVILTDVEPGAFTSSSKHLYVGATRARHVLVVVKTMARTVAS